MNNRKEDYPDQWNGWAIKNGYIDYSLDNINYLRDRKIYLTENIINKDSEKILNELNSYHNKQILAWGCGSGKTTKIKYFCSKTKEPTIVVVKTNQEIMQLVFDIKALNPEQSVCGVYDNKDIIDCIENDIHYLEKFRIVITNNWRFLTEVSEIFLNYNDGKISNRSLILFDEFPAVYKDFIVNQKEFVYQLYKMNKHILANVKRSIRQDKTKENILNNIELCSIVLNMESNTKLKRARIKKLMKRYLDFLSIAPDTLTMEDNFTITNQIDWVLKENNTKIVILDATANILFQGSKEWNINEYAQKKVKINKVNYFRLSCLRNTRKSLSNHKKDLEKDIFELNTFIKKSYSKKHLIVTWKDTDHFPDFPKYILEHIDNELRDKVEIIYYNSGECRATNKYKQCDSIIFFGEWFYSSLDAERISTVVNSHITAENLALSEIIQAIFRTQARDNLPIEMTFFYTLNKEYINNLDKFDKALLSVIDGDCKDIIVMQHSIRAAELDLNIRTFEKLKIFIELYKIDKVSSKILNFYIRFSDVKNIFDFKSRRDARPLKDALSKFININLIFER